MQNTEYVSARLIHSLHQNPSSWLFKEYLLYPHLIQKIYYLNLHHHICLVISFIDTFLAVLARCLGDICLVQNMGGVTKKVWSNEKRMQSIMQMARIYMTVIKIRDCEEILKQRTLPRIMSPFWESWRQGKARWEWAKEHDSQYSFPLQRHLWTIQNVSISN